MTIVLTFCIGISFRVLGVYAKQESSPNLPQIAQKIQNGTLTSSEKPSDSQQQSTGYLYNYTQIGYYQKPFVIEMGWNLNGNGQYPDFRRTEITLPDNSKIWMR